MRKMDEALLQLLLGLVASIATVGLAYLKQTMAKKGISEEQSDLILDFVEDKVSELKKAFPSDGRITTFEKQLRKLRTMWDKETVTTDDMQDYLDEIAG